MPVVASNKSFSSPLKGLHLGLFRRAVIKWHCNRVPIAAAPALSKVEAIKSAASHVILDPLKKEGYFVILLTWAEFLLRFFND